MCLSENAHSWPDVYSHFSFEISHSTFCCGCHTTFTTETTQIFVELQAPSSNANLNDYIEQELNGSSLVGMRCDGNCQQFMQVEKSS